jgi:hypothetical protein
MSRETRHIATYEGRGVFTHRETNEDHAVHCHLREEEEYIPYRDGREVVTRRNFEGKMWPVPVGTQFFGKPHTLKLGDGRVLECWVHNADGDVRCQMARNA